MTHILLKRFVLESVNMGKISANQKLELVRMVRMQHQFNRNECRERERFLYGKSSYPVTKGEIYGAESTTYLPGREDVMPGYEKDKLFTGFRIRFFFAVVLFGVFIFLDKNQIAIYGTTTADLFQMMLQSLHLPG